MINRRLASIATGAILIAAGIRFLRPSGLDASSEQHSEGSATVRFDSNDGAESGPHRPLRQGNALLVVFTVFALLAFSEEIIEVVWAPVNWWRVAALDFGLLVLVWLSGRRTRRRDSTEPLELPSFWAGGGFLAVGAALMLALDVVLLGLLDLSELPRAADVLLPLAWVVPLFLLVCFALAVNPWRLPRALREGEVGAQRAREKIVSSLPLLAGVAAAYIGQDLYFEELRGIDREYFEQLTQVIPVLLIALGIDAWFLSADGHHFDHALGDQRLCGRPASDRRGSRHIGPPCRQRNAGGLALPMA